jgi:hypothetical protein
MEEKKRKIQETKGEMKQSGKSRWKVERRKRECRKLMETEVA